MTTNLSSSTFDNGHRKATVLVCSEYLGLAPAPNRLPPCLCFFIYYKIKFAPIKTNPTINLT
ncbi:MAG: hypothetical protein ACK50L_02410 [Bacteroidota bacterium]